MLAGWLGSMKMGLWRFLGLNENYSVWEKMKWKQRGYWRDQDWSEWKSNGVRGRRLERVRLFADQHFLPHRPASFPLVMLEWAENFKSLPQYCPVMTRHHWTMWTCQQYFFHQSLHFVHMSPIGTCTTGRLQTIHPRSSHRQTVALKVQGPDDF